MTMHLQSEPPAIECRLVTKRYRSRSLFHRHPVNALDGVSFSIPSGQMTGLIGPNGAGKTTLLALIVGLLRPDNGVLRIFGHKTRTLEARRCLRYMPETPAFLDGYTGRQVLKYHAALAGLTRRAIPREAERLIELMELADIADRSTGTYSQGMKQRLGLAVALLGNPRILLLDEPSNGLDPAGVIQLREVLKEQNRNGTTILISSHRLAELEKLTPLTIFLNKGRIVREGKTVDEEAGGRLRIEFLPGGPPQDDMLRGLDVVEISESHLSIQIKDPSEIPPIVGMLAKAGVPIVGVRMEKEDMEETFMRLYAGKG
jgi:ABC-type multidrug transport system ATPase subunit